MKKYKKIIVSTVVLTIILLIIGVQYGQNMSHNSVGNPVASHQPIDNSISDSALVDTSVSSSSNNNSTPEVESTWEPGIAEKLSSDEIAVPEAGSAIALEKNNEQLKPSEKSAPDEPSSVTTNKKVTSNATTKPNTAKAPKQVTPQTHQRENITPPLTTERERNEKNANADTNDLELTLAKTANFVGDLLTTETDKSDMVRGVITSAVNGEIESWLSQYAYAQVQLSLDKNLSLQNSQLDLLFPLHEEENSISFLQTSFHRTDDRNQMNIGLGYRWFATDWMLGGNTFFDYDLSRGHARFGIGLEYSRDFLRVGVNRYLRLTNWKTSPVLNDYNERPADGWDIRLQGWLPQLPQLGGKLIYEQYYGDEVALTNATERVKNPTAITAGVEYSPFPLLSFSIDNKQILSGSNDTSFSVQLNYELGVPWATQIDPDTLAQARSLIHNRYELVERNNNIILEYQKQPVIVIKMVKEISGYPNESKPLMVVVKSKYGYDSADINIVPNGDFLKDGGRIDQTGETTYYAVLPTPTGTNEYTITGTVKDKHNNPSNTAKTRVTVKGITIDKTQSRFILALEAEDKDYIFANNSDTAAFILTAKNSKGEMEDVLLDDIKIVPKV